MKKYVYIHFSDSERGEISQAIVGVETQPRWRISEYVQAAKEVVEMIQNRENIRIMDYVYFGEINLYS